MIYRPAPLFALAVLAFSIALLIAVGIWYSGTGSESPRAASHLTQADWQTTHARSFSVPPPTLDSRALPDAWQRTTMPGALPSHASLLAGRSTSPGAPRAVDVTWIRFATHALRVSPGPLALYGARVKTDGTVAIYIDGKLVHREQEDGPLWNSLFMPLWVVFDSADSTDGTAGSGPPREVLVRLEHAADTQVALSSLWLGSASALRGRYYVRQWLQRELPVTLSAAFLVVGVFALCVWFRRRSETGYLLFFNLAATSFVGHLHYYASLPIANDWFAWLTINALFWMVGVVHFFLCQMHGRPLKGLTFAVVGVIVLITVLTMPVVGVLPVLPTTPVVIPLIYAVSVLLAVVVGLVGVLSAWRRSKEARLVAVGVGVCTLLGATDWMMHNNVLSPEGWFLGAYMNAVTFAMFGVLMYRRYVSAIEEFESINANLAHRLKEREAELEISHRRLREVERRQAIGEERQRLMQDMHDGLGSSLISAIRSVERGGASEVEVSRVLRSCLDDLKLTLDSMEPVEADLLLLLATLRFRLEPRLDGTGVALLWDVHVLPAVSWLDPSSALQILRIVQESIANVLHHTRASTIRVSTGVERDGVQVIVEDNGQGFDVRHALQLAAGRGLVNQQRRARAIGGEVSWDSGVAGTRFTLWLPLERHPLMA